MAHGRAQKLVEGAVVAIPLPGKRWALGQVLVPGISFYFGAATAPFNQLPKASDIEGLSFTVFSWTNDAEVYRGNWKCLGTHALQSCSSLLVEYKVGMPKGLMVEAFSGEILRPYDPKIDAHLEYRKSRSPLLVQDMVWRACGE